MKHWGSLTITAAAIAIVVSGCTPAPVAEPAPTARPAAPASLATDISGDWTVTDLADESTVSVTFDGAEWSTTYPCGKAAGFWVTAGSVFLAQLGSFDQSCLVDGGFTVRWADLAVAFAQTATGWELLDANNAPVATLSNRQPVSRVPEWPQLVQPFAEQVTALSTTLSLDKLTGRWIPLVDDPGRSFVEFSETTWGSTDGCNESGGKWSDLGDGYILTMGYPYITQVGCENIPVEGWVSSARTAGFDGDILVLFDADGSELGSLTRA